MKAKTFVKRNPVSAEATGSYIGLTGQDPGPTFPIQRTAGHLTLAELLDALESAGAIETTALRDEIARRVK